MRERNNKRSSSHVFVLSGPSRRLQVHRSNSGLERWLRSSSLLFEPVLDLQEAGQLQIRKMRSDWMSGIWAKEEKSIWDVDQREAVRVYCRSLFQLTYSHPPTNNCLYLRSTTLQQERQVTCEPWGDNRLYWKWDHLVPEACYRKDFSFSLKALRTIGTSLCSREL